MFTSDARIAGFHVHLELCGARSEGIKFWVWYADVTGWSAGADAVDIAEYISRAAETGRVQLLQRRQIGIRCDAASNTHPSKQRRFHDDDVTVMTTCPKRLHVAIFVQTHSWSTYPILYISLWVSLVVRCCSCSTGAYRSTALWSQYYTL